jgi:hypothetical protein
MFPLLREVRGKNRASSAMYQGGVRKVPRLPQDRPTDCGWALL